MKAYLIKLYPNKTQQKALDANFGCCRFVYNKMLEISQKTYKRRGKKLSGYDMSNYLPKLKKQYSFLKESDAQTLQKSCMNLASAYNKFFRHQAGYPKFKKKAGRQSFSTISCCRLLEKQIKIPKIGLIKFKGGDKPTGKAKTFTISRYATGYYASIIIDDGKDKPLKQAIKNVVGIDLGIKDFAILSNGLRVKNKKFTKSSERKLRKWQKALSRRKIGSKKREQAKLMLSRVHKKINNQRKDFHHKISRQIVNSCDNQTAVAVESLKCSNLVKNHTLAKSIADCGWYQFGAFLKYKSGDVGKQVIEIGRFYPSSKTCSSCGIVNGDLKLSDRNWTCSSCESEHDRDLNAAVNIAMEGARIYKADRKFAGGEEISLETILQNISEAASVKPLTQLGQSDSFSASCK